MKAMKVLQKKQQRTLGAIILIPLEDGFHTYGRILQGASYAFYDCRTKEDIADLNYIISSPVLFITAVYNNVINSGQWVKIGKLPLEEKFNILPPRFIQDAFHKDKFRIVYQDRTEKEVSIEECEGLERFMVWEAANIEKRLSDYYAGRKTQVVGEKINPDLMKNDSRKTIYSKKSPVLANRKMA
ncbi:MAG: immunity 26/phosphotriesterase HocA family protein [Leptospiraceae bacterium]|nr:immunity 26/phosphotriesterase HocA family protein [Leptospiraceae bacterium]